jgi:hypothetical protein
MKAERIYVARKVSNNGESLYCVPVTKPNAKAEVFDDDCVSLDFSEEDEDPSEYVNTFWEKKVGLLTSNDEGSYTTISPLDAYEALRAYEEEINEHLEALQAELIDNATERLKALQSERNQPDESDE